MRVLLTTAVLLAIVASAAFCAQVQIATTDLIAGKTIDVGAVTVYQDDGTGVVTVVIDADAPWEMDETHLYIGSVPPEKQSPGKFPYQHEDLGWVSQDTYDLGVLAADTYYIAVQAEVRENLGDADGDQDIDQDDEALYPEESAWGDGQLIRANGPWAMYFSFTVPALD